MVGGSLQHPDHHRDDCFVVEGNQLVSPSHIQVGPKQASPSVSLGSGMGSSKTQKNFKNKQINVKNTEKR